MNILAIESSFDETATAVVKDGTTVLSHALASSHEMHNKYGGILPELAAREQLSSILPVLNETMNIFQQSDNLTIQQLLIDNIDAIAVTTGPGLIGSLLVGVESAKTLSYVTGKPIIPVNHVLAHMYANFVQHNNSTIQFPAISLVASGGHTELFLMTSPKDLKWLGGTLDDAAGEAFDKTARLLGFEHRGGVAIQEAAQRFIVHSSQFTVKLPRPLMHDDTLNFSFSGLKTAVLREVNKLKTNQQFNNESIQQLAHEIQEAITDVLVAKTIRAAEKYDAKSILISGGVASNLRLREKFLVHSSHLPTGKAGFTVAIPEVSLCTDNAVSIGSYAFFRGKAVPWSEVTATPELSVEV